MRNAQALVSGVDPDTRIQELAEELTAYVGRVDLRKEKSGLQAYMACPLCYEKYGPSELDKRHLAVNVEKYLGLGAHAHSYRPGKRRDRNTSRGYAQCMKEHGPFTVDQIKSYGLAETWQAVAPRCVVFRQDRTGYLITDARGNKIPDHPGDVTPLTQLPHDHPAMEYLRDRDYDPYLLQAQFRASWCWREAPPGDEFGRYYRSHPDDWRSTPQGRIIFYSDVDGVQMCWQARYLEMVRDGAVQVWHPYREEWTPRPAWEKKETPIKYMTAPGSSGFRSDSLGGWDNAVVHIRSDDPFPVCALAEGPLDAARFPNAGLYLAGASLTDTQLLLLKLKFKGVVLAVDDDVPGSVAANKIERRLRAAGLHARRFFPERQSYAENHVKVDVGQLGYTICRARFHQLAQELRTNQSNK